MCCHNNRLDSSFCWKCCNPNRKLEEIDLTGLIVSPNGNIQYDIKPDSHGIECLSDVTGNGNL